MKDSCCKNKCAIPPNWILGCNSAKVDTPKMYELSRKMQCIDIMEFHCLRWLNEVLLSHVPVLILNINNYFIQNDAQYMCAVYIKRTCTLV